MGYPRSLLAVKAQNFPSFDLIGFTIRRKALEDETRAHSVANTSLELIMVRLPQASEWWHYRSELPHPAMRVG